MAESNQQQGEGEQKSVLTKISEGVQNAASNLATQVSGGVHGVVNKVKGVEEADEDGTKRFHNVKDGVNETVADLKHEQRVESLGGQDQLVSNNPFDSLASNEKEAEPGLLDKVKSALGGNKETEDK